MKLKINQPYLRTFVILFAVWLAACSAGYATYVSGTVLVRSTWEDDDPTFNPPGDGDGSGDLLVGLWNAASRAEGPPFVVSNLLTGVAMPFAAGVPYTFTLTDPVTGFLEDGGYFVIAWVDADADGQYDLGEPRNIALVASISAGDASIGNTVTVVDDSDEDDLPDWWEAHWFAAAIKPLDQGASDDPDGDGLTNLQEYNISTRLPVMDHINPANWDTDNDGMDDKWEYIHYFQADALGLNPTASNRYEDVDGDGLSSWQEYCGIDGDPLMVLEGYVDGVYEGKEGTGDADDLNPLDVDTDYDLLIDSFEAAWYDTVNSIDPRDGILAVPPEEPGDVDSSIARQDSDNDGLSNYREMCLLAEFREGAVNGDKWVYTDRVPFPYNIYYTDDEDPVRVCLMSTSGADLNLGLDMEDVIANNRAGLRDQEWTDPTDGTSYTYADENIPMGFDTDDDWLPDGWEVQFNLDPRDRGDNTGTGWTHGPFGDPDGDAIANWYEYLGQDGQRYATREYINGSGDETNPNEYNHRPDSTYEWRWYPDNVLYEQNTDLRPGTGISRIETLGSALPTTSLGTDDGMDTDDDGITDVEEIYPANGVCSSPVYSCDPYNPQSALITDTAGILIPDPEPAGATNYAPAGIREDLCRGSWAIECQIKLLANNMSGDLFKFQTAEGSFPRLVYRLSLANNVPSLVVQNAAGQYNVVLANALPTNRWIHIAGVWDNKADSLNLYVQGVLFMGTNINGNLVTSFSPATNIFALGASADGSFVNNLKMDEVRIWGVPRTPEQISEYASTLIPQSLGDDVWISQSGNQYYGSNDVLLVQGGSLFEGEPGVILSNVYKYSDAYWIDDGDGKYEQNSDILLTHQVGQVFEGAIGIRVFNVYYNDKDGSGDYTRHSLLAYYRFDDGGTTAEDFARKAQNGLIQAVHEAMLFGDMGYALPTAGFSWDTDAAPVVGSQPSAADDTDGDGLPDAWELINHLNAYDNGFGGQSAAGKLDGPFGAYGDLDGDGLKNIYEYWAGTNPRSDDSDGDGIPDTQEDVDGDNVSNLTEQKLGSRPDHVDTDDDGQTDSQEQQGGTNPADPGDPPVSRALTFGGTMSDYLQVPGCYAQRLTDWTVEAYVNPASVAAGEGIVIRRAVQNIGAGVYALNYVLGIESDGSGGLQAYAGYVMANGTEYMIRGGAIPAGSWTQISATYDNLSATLVLYVGGVAVANTSLFDVTPPINGKGGEYFLRIGEDFGGMLDEIRIWNYARTEEQVTASYDETVLRTSSGLVHYFRLDDGQAAVDPKGAQDWTWPNDWTEMWKHAAIVNGAVTFVEPGAIVPPATLRVILMPASAVTDGAMWSFDGGAWQESETTMYEVPAGVHDLLYKTIEGWTAPTSEQVNLLSGTATTLTRTYIRNGAVTINLEPIEAVDAGAVWRVDGGDWQDDGAIVENLSPGSHNVEYLALDGWTEPASEAVTISSSSTSSLTRTYTQSTGWLRVNLAPADAVTDGAHWRVDTGTWRTNSALVEVSVGSHQVDYQDVTGWIAPFSELVNILNNSTTTINRVYSEDASADLDSDGMLDTWEVTWWGNLDATASEDDDKDGLSNIQEFTISQSFAALSGLSPVNFDTDSDGMDDSFEYQNYANGFGLNATVDDAADDADGDGLMNVSEYLGMDGKAPMVQDPTSAPGVASEDVMSTDELNPLDIDTDNDSLIDSFEAAWDGAWASIPESIVNWDDGLTDYREQCLLAELREGGPNDIWTMGTNSLPVADANGLRAFVPPLLLGATLGTSIADNLVPLRSQEWTSPFNTDTDGDSLPDGWEVEFGLDPQDDTGANGYAGDPDGDGLVNAEEFYGQDGRRSATRQFVNGTGDETSPYLHNHRPDSTYEWRWSVNWILSGFNSATPNGDGNERGTTLGGTLPTESIGSDLGADTDDDGIDDGLEIHPGAGLMASSPVHSCDPFIRRSALVTDAAGIAIPDPEPNSFGVREDLQRRDWTIECYVKLLAEGMSGYLINFETEIGGVSRVVYRLSLSNNVPTLVAANSAGSVYAVSANELPTNEWIHVAGVWDSENNNLALYIHGVLHMGQAVYGESLSALQYPATNDLALAVSPDGSFVNSLLLDEVRIWGLARTEAQIAEYARRIPLPAVGDDAWVDEADDGTGRAYIYRTAYTDQILVNGGAMFEGEPGIPATNAVVSFKNVAPSVKGIYTVGEDVWLDDGDFIYESERDVLLVDGGSLTEGEVGAKFLYYLGSDNPSGVYWSDKDGDGKFTRNGLLAYYRFDDGGATAEDFARRAKNSLLNPWSENYAFGDFGYALSAANFTWVTNDYAPVQGVELYGADDSDGDGMADGWEISNNLNPYDNGTGHENPAGSANGPEGPMGDQDADGLRNLYEYWAGTNPRASDSDQDGILDINEDLDGDGVANLIEQALSSRPDKADTDDDSLTDNVEQGMGSNPANSTDPQVSRSLSLGGAAQDYLEIPLGPYQGLTEWTLEAWVNPRTNIAESSGTVIRRVVETSTSGTHVINFMMGLTNVGSVLQIYAGYALPGGQQRILQGLSVTATGGWTHIAASYDAINGEITIYTNGVPALSGSGFREMPPVNGRGGSTFVRIGEDYAGLIDDVRVWGDARTDAEIEDYYYDYVSAGEDLVHYFRFDDSQASDAGGIAFGPYHRQEGAEDYVFPKDWNQQWMHAARLNGNASFSTNGAIEPPPSVRIILLPDAAVLAGAQWSIDDGPWLDSGVTVSDLDRFDLTHTITYRSILGWSAPANETITVTNGQTLILNRTYVQRGSLTVTIQPMEVNDAAKIVYDSTVGPYLWSIGNIGDGALRDGLIWHTNGTTLANLEIGTYTLRFYPVPGWNTPASRDIVITEGTAVSAIGHYTDVEGYIHATILPTNAVADGAMWRVDSGEWRASDTASAVLDYGFHQVEFLYVPPWITPAPVTVIVSNNGIYEVQGTYQEVSGIYVEIHPPEAITAGALWTMNGTDYDSGTLIPLSEGDYGITFTQLDGWLSPPEQLVTVYSNETTVINAYYLKSEPLLAEPGQLNEPRGLALDSQRRLYIADSGNDRVVVLDTTDDSTTVIGSYGSAAGLFNWPVGVAVDAADNLYVADALNYRVQRRTPAGAWVTWGSFGTALGQFKTPYDVEVDSRTNLYVADRDNHRVQKRSPAGTWTLFASNGLAVGTVQNPIGLAVDSSNVVYVADWTDDDNGRVQRFTTNFVGTRIGSYLASEGELLMPRGMTFGRSNNLYAVDMSSGEVSAGTDIGQWMTLVSSGLLSGPEDVEWDPRGYLYICDTLNNRILRVEIGLSGNIPPAVLSTTVDASGITINWLGAEGWFYTIQYSDDSPAGPYTDLPGAIGIPGVDGPMSFVDTSADGMRFYRILLY
ncbi:MAG: LamG-like jellyroll fold domain-containing protein [Kiritimatiellia bacterium]